MVHALIDNHKWNKDIIHFAQWEAHEILKMHLPLFPQKDEWTWHFTRDGSFTVKSASYVELKGMLNNAASSSRVSKSNLWSQIRSANVPTKRRNFGWRGCKDGLPVRSNLSFSAFPNQSKLTVSATKDRVNAR